MEPITKYAKFTPKDGKSEYFRNGNVPQFVQDDEQDLGKIARFITERFPKYRRRLVKMDILKNGKPETINVVDDDGKLVYVTGIIAFLNYGISLACAAEVTPGSVSKTFKLTTARTHLFKAAKTDPTLKDSFFDAMGKGLEERFLLDYYESIGDEGQ